MNKQNSRVTMNMNTMMQMQIKYLTHTWGALKKFQLNTIPAQSNW